MTIDTDFDAVHFQRALAKGGPAAESAARQLIRAYRRRLRALYFAGGVDAKDIDDLVSEVLSKVVAGIASLQDPARFDAWIMRIATNVRHEHWTRVGRERAHFVDERISVERLDDEQASHALFGLPDNGQSDPATALCVDRQLEKLSVEHPRHYACVALLVEGLTPHEIAEHLGRAGGATRQFISQSCAIAFRYVKACFESAQLSGLKRGNALIDGSGSVT